MNLLVGFLLGLLAQLITFAQLQGQFKYAWARDNPFLMSLLGIPLSLLYIGSVKHLVAYFGGELWPSRLMGFAIGAMVFTAMSWIWFKEPLSLKTLICLGLALCIMGIQLFWK